MTEERVSHTTRRTRGLEPGADQCDADQDSAAAHRRSEEREPERTTRPGPRRPRDRIRIWVGPGYLGCSSALPGAPRGPGTRTQPERGAKACDGSCAGTFPGYLW